MNALPLTELFSEKPVKKLIGRADMDALMRLDELAQLGGLNAYRASSEGGQYRR